MDFRLLGPLEVSDQHRALALGGLKQRSLLAVLLLHANEIVATDRLIAELWGEAPPATASKSIQAYVIAAAARARRRPAHHARARLRAARRTGRARRRGVRAPARRGAREPSPRARRRSCAPRSACGAARRSPTSPTSRSRRPRSCGSRSCGWRRWRSGSTPTSRAGATPTSSASSRRSIAAHPLRERLRAQLMLALYRSGRQAEALQVYRAARRELADELGLEPGEELRRLERAILAHDPELDGRASLRRRSGAAGDRALAAGLPARRRGARRAAPAGVGARRRPDAARADPGARRGGGRARRRVARARRSRRGAAAAAGSPPVPPRSPPRPRGATSHGWPHSRTSTCC